MAVSQPEKKEIEGYFIMYAGIQIRQKLEEINRTLPKPYTNTDIEILVTRFSERFVDLVNFTIKEDHNLSLSIREIEIFALQKIIDEMDTLDRAITHTVKNSLKECKWCKQLIYDDDEYCSPECLEKDANNFLKQKDLP
jgi:hypothetical protein